MKRDYVSCLGRQGEPKCNHCTFVGQKKILFCQHYNLFVKFGKKPCKKREVSNGSDQGTQ